MCAVQGHVLDDEISLTDEVVLHELCRPEVDLNGTQNRLETIETLGAGGVVDHVHGDQVVQDRVAARTLPSDQLLDHLPSTAWAGPGHRLWPGIGQVGPRHAVGMPGGPLDELDSITIRVGDPCR